MRTGAATEVQNPPDRDPGITVEAFLKEIHLLAYVPEGECNFVISSVVIYIAGFKGHFPQLRKHLQPTDLVQAGLA
jgi:hypothetical protein